VAGAWGWQLYHLLKIWEPQPKRLCKPVMGLLYLYLYLTLFKHPHLSDSPMHKAVDSFRKHHSKRVFIALILCALYRCCCNNFKISVHLYLTLCFIHFIRRIQKIVDVD
jgi:hypothetical protein